MINQTPDTEIDLEFSLEPGTYYFGNHDYYSFNSDDDYKDLFMKQFTRKVKFKTLSIQDDPNFTETVDGKPAYLKADILHLKDNEVVLELLTNYDSYVNYNRLTISENEDFSNPVYDGKITFGKKIGLEGLSASTTYHMKVVIHRLICSSGQYLENVSLIPTPGSFTTAAEGTFITLEDKFTSVIIHDYGKYYLECQLPEGYTYFGYGEDGQYNLYCKSADQENYQFVSSVNYGNTSTKSFELKNLKKRVEYMYYIEGPFETDYWTYPADTRMYPITPTFTIQ